LTVTQEDLATRDALLARLAQSRSEIRRLLEPQADAGNADAGASRGRTRGGFPRSRTMQTLMSGRGIGAIGAVAGGLLLARPALAWRLIRLLPTSALARMVVARIARALGASAKPGGASRGAP
jgi:hypothetical protein